ncbi:MAG: hypothetical protein BRC31_01915, partial [Actinobacteria bacterium QS_5_72_10]
DSHFGDHEPVLVFVDSASGELGRVAASVYHWSKGQAPAEQVPLYDGTHPKLRVIDPWHHYTETTEDGVLEPVEDLSDVYQSWLDNGLEDDLHPGANTDPWRMRTRGHWWRDAAFGFSPTAVQIGAARRLGFGVAGTIGGST